MNIIGFDIGALLTHDCKIPALMYLLHRVEQALAEQRGIIFCDEGWQALNDEYFRTIINNWSRTLRKKNYLFGLATQLVHDIAHHPLHRVFYESASCKIFFPNPAADQAVYQEQLGLSQREYHLIRTLPDHEHYFLLHHGRASNKHSVVVRANLTGLEDIMAIISARDGTLAILDQVRAEVGDNPDQWLPLFHARRIQRGSL
jgi:type IV secretion system protein VirB4